MEQIRSNLSGKKVRLLTFYHEGFQLGFDAINLASIEPLLSGTELPDDVKTIDSHLGLSRHNENGYSHALHFKHLSGSGSIIAINGPVNLVELPSEKIYPMPQFVSARIAYTNVLALGKADEDFFVLLNI